MEPFLPDLVLALGFVSGAIELELVDQPRAAFRADLRQEALRRVALDGRHGALKE